MSDECESITSNIKQKVHNNCKEGKQNIQFRDREDQLRAEIFQDKVRTGGQSRIMNEWVFVFRRIRERLLGQKNNMNRIETSMLSLRDHREINVVGIEIEGK